MSTKQRRVHATARPRVRRGLALALLIVALLPSLLLPRTVHGQGQTVLVRAWSCPPGGAPVTADPSTLAAACTTPANDLAFSLQFGDRAPLTRITGVSLVGGVPTEGQVEWTQILQGRFRLSLDAPPPGAESVIFVSQGGSPTPVTLADGAVTGDQVPPEGLVYDWYIVLPPEPTATATPSPTETPLPPTLTPEPTTAPTATATSTASPEPAPTTTPPEPSPAPAPSNVAGRIRTLKALPGASFSHAWAINDVGQVVGSSGTLDEEGRILWQHAALWQHAEVQDLGTLEGGTASEALDINELGQIVGSSNTEDGSVRAVLWWNGAVQDLGTLGGATSQAWAINVAGQVVGAADTAEGERHAFLWDGAMHDLGTLGGVSSAAFDINDDGIVVGQSVRSDGLPRAFRWEASGPMEDLGTLGGDHGLATDVNAAGVVAGASHTTNNEAVHATTWASGADPHDLGTLEGKRVSVGAINDSGIVVGYACPIAVPCSASQENQAVVWQNGEPTDLNEMLSETNKARWKLQSAYDINNNGEVVGIGAITLEDSGRILQRGFIISTGAPPTPTPTVGPATPSPEPKPAPPPEVKYGDHYYLRDREVPIVDPATLLPVGGDENTGLMVYARQADPPYAAVYIPVSENPADGYIRYLNEQLDRPQEECPAEGTGASFGDFSLPSATDPESAEFIGMYIFAGYEPDLTNDLLEESKDYPGTGLKQVFGPAQPGELYRSQEDGRLQRYILIPKDGLPTQLASPLAFAGQTFRYTNDVEDMSQLPQLRRVGCAGPFPVRATIGEEVGAFSKVYASVGDRVLVFTASTAMAPGPDQIGLAWRPAANDLRSSLAGVATTPYPPSPAVGAQRFPERAITSDRIVMPSPRGNRPAPRVVRSASGAQR